MKTALIFIVLWSLSSAFYINHFRKWKGDDSDEKGALKNRYGYFVKRVHVQAPPKYITYAKAGGSSEEEDSSDEQEDSVDAGKNGKNAASEEAGGEGTKGKGAEEEEADSEGGEEENGGTSAPEVEESTASMNETGTEQTSSASESSTDVQPTQVGTIEPATTQLQEDAGVPTELPRSSDYEHVGTEEGSNGGVASTTAPYDPEYNEYQYENGYYDHENEVDPRRVRGDNYVRYEDEYDPYAHQY
ncbi:integrin-binding sialoprotein isoform X1 [Aquarana catesbeiana]|uniref:integrin-binding sialoprotein isoform X1 n=1 Tax=Aquarana catesbeiana TaxID=8400 RepID=UPI003CCA6D47